MSSCVTPKLDKWPFVLGDALLVAIAAVIVFKTPSPLGFWEAVLASACVAAGALLGALPFLREHAVAVKLTEAEVLATTVSQIGNLEQIKNQIGHATTQWDLVQRHSTESVAAAKELTDRLAAEREQFCAFLQRTNDAEKNHLRLEVEKLRRGERDWLQAMVTVLDHIFALHSAGARSGQPGLATQLNQFQMACRDAARRLGLVGFAPGPGDPFDPRAHQTDTGAAAANGASRVRDVLAPGFTYRGELVRPALVKLDESGEQQTDGGRASASGAHSSADRPPELDAAETSSLDPA